MKLILRNLSRETTESELKSLLANYGHVQSCDLVLDKETGKSKGFAFANMPHNHQAVHLSKAAFQIGRAHV